MSTDSQPQKENLPEKTSIPLTRRINKILETRIENDKDMLDALKEVSTFYTENNIRSRRNLRGQIEQRSVAINEEFVAALKHVKDVVDHLYSEVSSMNEVCVDMKRRLQVTKSETSHLIHQTNSLNSQSQKVKMQEDVANAFINTFQLSDEEFAFLQGSKKDIVVNTEFFITLDKIQRIRSNTKYLLQTGHQKTALEIMEQMNVSREAALEFLYRWFQHQTHSSELSPYLSSALAALEERPVLFNLVIEEWIVVHKGWLVREFLDALTMGGPGGAPRPIELQAHDPLRYVGDMLAWVHQALPAEKEACQTLFSKCKNIDMVQKIKETVSSTSESVCRPLKNRIEQIIVSDLGREGGKKPVQLYKISSLLRFYQNTIQQVTGSGVLVTTLNELQTLSHKMFLSSLQTQVSHACERVEAPGETLAPTAGLSKTLGLLTEVVTAATLAEDVNRDFEQIINCVIDPLMNAVNESAASLGAVESAIYLLNCLHQLYSTLSLLQAGTQKLEMIQGYIDAQLDTLGQEQINAVFHSLGLANMYSVIINPPEAPLSSHPTCQPLAIQSFRAKLDAFLSAPDHIMLPHSRLLLSSAHRRHVHQSTAHAVVAVFSQLYALVNDSNNGYPDPSTLLPRDPDTVKNLLL